jgi:ribosomal protein RSM22 (predicted rRNA methylase)
MCIDHSKAMRSVAQKLLRRHVEIGRISKATILDALPTNITDGKFDLIVAANVFAEMPEDRTLEALEVLISLLSQEGRLVLLEPGQSAHTRRLMTLRNIVLTRWCTLQVLFPCRRQDNCPMLTTSKSDWCHTTLSWSRPTLVRQLDELLGFNKHRLKYSAFVLGKSNGSLDDYRVIEGGTRDKRGIRAVVCGKDYYGPVRISAGSRGPHNRALEKSESYALLAFSTPPGHSLPEDTQVFSVE